MQASPLLDVSMIHPLFHGAHAHAHGLFLTAVRKTMTPHVGQSLYFALPPLQMPAHGLDQSVDCLSVFLPPFLPDRRI